MKNRPVIIVVIGYIIGILMGLYLFRGIVPFYFLALFLIIYVLTKCKFKRYFRYVKVNFNFSSIVCILISFSLGCVYINYLESMYQSTYERMENAETIEGEAIVISNKEEKNQKKVYIVKLCSNGENKKFYMKTDLKVKDIK